jgi:aminoglycoside phosphotransferase (APT) family kinase protein
MLPDALPNPGPVLLACPICHGPLLDGLGRAHCRPCAVHFPCEDGVYLLDPPFASRPAPPGPYAARMRQLLDDATRHGWERARTTFTADVLSGDLPAAERSRWARARAKLAGTTWEDTLQDLVDPTRAGWKFLLDLRPHARVLFLGPSWGAALVGLARSVGHVTVLDGLLERLRLARAQAVGDGLVNLTFARVADGVALPLPDEAVDLVVVPGLAEWFAAVDGRRILPGGLRLELLRELRRVLAPGGQAWVATDNRASTGWLLGSLRPAGATFTPRGLRRAAADAGFAASALYAPIPFRHKFHQVLDIDGTTRMNFCADPYRTRGRLLRPAVKLWDRWNRAGALERRLYPALPGLGAVLTADAAPQSFAERLIHHLAADGRVARAAAQLSRYYVRPKGVAVLVAGSPAQGVVVRLPLDERATANCVRHHRTLELLAGDARLPPALRRLFPTPIAEGMFDGQRFFAETGLRGELGRVYYSRPVRRYDRAIVTAAETLRQLRRATEEPVRIDEPEFDRLCGAWLGELRELVGPQSRGALDAMATMLRETLLGATVPLGWYHGDYDFANLLYGPDDGVTGILDFEIFDPRGLPLIDLLLLLARRPIRDGGQAFGTLFVRSIFQRVLPPLESDLLAQEMRTLAIDDRLYRAIALCCWLNHLRLRRDSWLVRSPSWLDSNLHSVVEHVRSML